MKEVDWLDRLAFREIEQINEVIISFNYTHFPILSFLLTATCILLKMWLMYVSHFGQFRRKKEIPT